VSLSTVELRFCVEKSKSELRRVVYGAGQPVCGRSRWSGRRNPSRIPQAVCSGCAVDAKGDGGFGEVVVMTLKNVLDEPLFKFPDGLVEQDPAADHLVNQTFKFGFHSSSGYSLYDF